MERERTFWRQHGYITGLARDFHLFIASLMGETVKMISPGTKVHVSNTERKSADTSEYCMVPEITTQVNDVFQITNI